MKSNNILLSYLQEVLKNLNNLYLLANPYFRLVKPSSEVLGRYPVNSRMPLCIVTVVYLVRVPLSITFSLIVNLALSVITPWEWVRKPKKEQRFFDSILLSQITTRSPDFNSDPLLGPIPRILCSKKKLLVFYLNGTRVLKPSLVRILTKQKTCSFLVNSKTLSPIATLQIFLGNVLAVNQLFRLFAKPEMRNKIAITILLKGVIFQFKRETLANLIMLRNFDQLTEFVSFNSLVLTIEGHAHEALLMKYVAENFPNVRISAIQHAPIVPSQVGYFNNLSLLRKNDNLLCSGVITARMSSKYLSEITSSPPIIKVLGSSKSDLIPKPKLENKVLAKDSILLLPEGTHSSLAELIEVLDYLAQFFRQKNFILRIHPATKLNAQLKRRIAQATSLNVRISRATLQEDFEQSSVCIYRSSAAAIQAMLFSVFPIHYSELSAFDLDPIPQSEIVHPDAHNAHSLSEFVSQIDSTLFVSEEYQKKLSAFGQQYFQKLDFKILDSI